MAYLLELVFVGVLIGLHSIPQVIYTKTPVPINGYHDNCLWGRQLFVERQNLLIQPLVGIYWQKSLYIQRPAQPERAFGLCGPPVRLSGKEGFSGIGRADAGQSGVKYPERPVETTIGKSVISSGMGIPFSTIFNLPYFQPWGASLWGAVSCIKSNIHDACSFQNRHFCSGQVVDPIVDPSL